MKMLMRAVTPPLREETHQSSPAPTRHSTPASPNFVRNSLSIFSHWSKIKAQGYQTLTKP
jgi:hypothetical protein